MEVQSTQSLSNNLNLKAAAPSYVSSSSNLGAQGSAVPQPSQHPGPLPPAMLQNKSETSSSAVPTPSPHNTEPYNYSYPYPMYQYGPYNQAAQAGYNYNCFYAQNPNGQVYMPGSKPAFYHQQYPPQSNINEPYVNGQFSQTNAPAAELKHSSKVTEHNVTDATPSKKKSNKKSDVNI